MIILSAAPAFLSDLSGLSDALMTGAGGAAAILLLAALAAREVACTIGGARAKRAVRALNVAIAPLLVAFCAAVAVRSLSLLHGI